MFKNILQESHVNGNVHVWVGGQDFNLDDPYL